MVDTLVLKTSYICSAGSSPVTSDSFYTSFKIYVFCKTLIKFGVVIAKRNR